MREVEGFVCLGRSEGFDVLFGPPNRQDPQQTRYDALDGNGLTPFQSLEQAQQVIAELKKRTRFQQVDINTIHLQIAESWEEVENFPAKGDFIILAELDHSMGWQLIGAQVKGVPAVYNGNGCDFRENGLEPFKKLKEALEAAKEVGRQGAGYTTIARINLQEIEPGV